MTRTSTVAPSIEPSTRGLCIGSLAAGSARLICGNTASASAKRAGPRRNGAFTFAARKRLYSAATWIFPSSPRIAQAHEDGPCTSTPLGRAMPPRRIVSSLLSSLIGCRVPRSRTQPELESRRRGAGVAAAHRPAVHGDDGCHFPHRGGEEDLARPEQPFEGIRALLHLVAQLRCELAERRACHPREHRQLERRGEQLRALAKPDIRGRRFEDRAVRGDEQRVVCAGFRRLVLRKN